MAKATTVKEPFFLVRRNRSTRIMVLTRTDRRMMRTSDVEEGFEHANGQLGAVSLRFDWRLLVDLRRAPDVQVDALVEASIARVRSSIYEGFERIAYLVGDSRRRFQLERCHRTGHNYEVFEDESAAEAFLRGQ